ncbi:MAG: hypothetical protein K2I02_07210, partial [Duncaniella sp.]|nr:hypothetical protein [Duncaniella sp.]
RGLGVVYMRQGTSRADDGELVTSGGRVIACSAYGKDIDEALANSYAAADTVNFAGKYMRRDIGLDLKKLS